MPSFPSVETTLRLVDLLYHRALDRGGEFKSHHCRRVVANLPAHAAGHDTRLAAALHDALEDLPIDADFLLGMGYPANVVWMVQRLTHNANQCSYEDYISRLIAEACPGLLLVKLADNTDNICLKRRALLSPANKSWHIDRCERIYYPTRKRLVEAIKALTGEVFE